MIAPKVSVVVPVYNSEKYLNKCLDSVINQTLHEIEIICINDGSTDGSADILDSYAKKDSRLKIITQENQGLSTTRNNGIKISRGEYISFVDSDDWIDEDFLEKLYYSAKNSNADIAVCSIVKIKNNKPKKLFTIKNKIQATKTIDKYKICKLPRSCYVVNRLYKKELFTENNIFFNTGVYFEDIEFSHKILHYSKKLITVPQVAYYYFNNPQSIVSVNSDKKYHDYWMAINNSIKFIKYNFIKYDLSQYPGQNSRKHYFLGLNILTIRENPAVCSWYLFNKIKIYSKTTHYLEIGM